MLFDDPIITILILITNQTFSIIPIIEEKVNSLNIIAIIVHTFLSFFWYNNLIILLSLQVINCDSKNSNN